MKKIKIIILAMTILFISGSCKKYLDAKSDLKLNTLSSLPDIQSLLDYYTNINYRCPGILEASSDNYFLSDANWNSLSFIQLKNLYVWNATNVITNYSARGGNDWSYTYDIIHKCNAAIEALNKIEKTGSNQATWNDIMGQALFIRSYFELQALWAWSLAYDATSSNNELGIPLKRSSDFNIPSKRESVSNCYNSILENLHFASSLLPFQTTSQIRPSKAAAYGTLARVYLSMRIYEKALLCADSCLESRNTLLDYNNLDSNATFPFKQFNEEVIYETAQTFPYQMNSVNVDTLLYSSYNDNDLRKTLYFQKLNNKQIQYKGSYCGSNLLFNGISTDEVHLIKAEAEVRIGNSEEGLIVLNNLLKKRWKKNTFEDFEASDSRSILELILKERRKELCFRGLRWIDIKRLNKEDENIMLRRIVESKAYELAPNDLRYAIALPEEIILLSEMPQNPR